jgi:hypothetical protein
MLLLDNKNVILLEESNKIKVTDRTTIAKGMNEKKYKKSIGKTNRDTSMCHSNYNFSF